MFMQNASIIWTVNIEMFITKLVVVRSRGISGWILQFGIAKFSSLNLVKLSVWFYPYIWLDPALWHILLLKTS